MNTSSLEASILFSVGLIYLNNIEQEFNKLWAVKLFTVSK